MARKGLYVAAQDARGFEIRAQGGGTASLDVSYRVVAQRKGLAPAHRLATLPEEASPEKVLERVRQKEQEQPRVTLPSPTDVPLDQPLPGAVPPPEPRSAPATLSPTPTSTTPTPAPSPTPRA